MFRLKNIIMTVLFLSFAFMLGCSDRKEPEKEDMTNFNKLKWMLGTWNGEQGDAKIFESWNKKSFRIMEGMGYTLLNGQRAYAQRMHIEQNFNKINLVLDLVDSPEKSTFRLKEVDDTHAVFENMNEGYPARLIYKKLSNNKMKVGLEGEKKNTDTELVFTRK